MNHAFSLNSHQIWSERDDEVFSSNLPAVVAHRLWSDIETLESVFFFWKSDSEAFKGLLCSVFTLYLLDLEEASVVESVWNLDSWDDRFDFFHLSSFRMCSVRWNVEQIGSGLLGSGARSRHCAT